LPTGHLPERTKYSILVSYRQVLLLQVCATFADNAAKERLDDVVNVLSFYFLLSFSEVLLAHLM